jgi:protein-disulfide isomerase
MADESTPAEQPAPAAKARPARKAKRKVKVSKTAAPTRAAPSSLGLNPALIALYVVLGLLVIGLSFYTGYLTGKMDAGGSVRGSGSQQLEGTLEIVEYSDFQCPFCSRAVPTIEQIKETYGDKVTVTYKNFPLESIHPNAFGAAVAAECVEKYAGEDAFWAYHDVLFANQNALDTASLKRYATDVTGDEDVQDCIDTQETAADVRAEMQEGQARGVQGTPSFWIKDELVVGAQPFSSFQAVIDSKLRGEAAAPAPSEPEAPAGPVDVDLGSNVMGDADAPVEIVEFSDFQCPFCQRFYQQTEQQIIDTYVKTGKAKLSYRHFPLSFHQNAQIAAEASECAAQQGKFWEMHDMLFDRGSGDGTGLDATSLKSYAAELKLDTAKFNKCLDNHETLSKVQADEQAGQDAGVSGTPTFYINGKQLVGAQPFSSFQPVIDAELS